jgi:hypothetical protein
MGKSEKQSIFSTGDLDPTDPLLKGDDYESYHHTKYKKHQSKHNANKQMCRIF